MNANSNAAMIATPDELADIENILADLELPISGELDAAEEPGTIIEEVPEPLIEAEAAEIAATVAEIEAEAAADEIELTATDLTPAEVPLVEIGEIDEADIAAATAALEREEAMQTHYAEQPAVEEDASIAPAEPAPGGKKTKAPRTPKPAKTPAAPKATLASLSDEAFVLGLSEEPADLAANKVAVIARRPAQVKVAEKFDNTLLALAAGKLPSTYTVDCYRVLKSAGRASSAALAAALTSTSKKQDTSATYTIGTARSQAGQFMALAPALKIATRDGKDLVLNPDSTIAAALDALLGL